jgi:drug/metabolite transporter (DMT)-like permease
MGLLVVVNAPSERRADIVRVVFASLAFATSSPLARLATGLPPTVVACGRTAIAACVLFLWRPRAALHAYRGLSRRGLTGLFAAGACLGAHFALFLGGLATTSFAAAVALLSLEPLAVVFVGWLAFGIAPKRPEWIGIALATMGAFVVSRGIGMGEHRLVGDLMVVGAVGLYALYVAAARGLRDALPPVPYVAGVYAISSVVLVPWVLLAMPSVSSPVPQGTWLALVALALVPTVVGHSLVQVAARTAPPAMVALTSPGETVGSLAIGALLLHRWPSPVEGAGAALIVMGAVVAIYGASMGTGERGGEVR